MPGTIKSFLIIRVTDTMVWAGPTVPPPALPGQTASPGLLAGNSPRYATPAKTALVVENPAFYPYSWHEQQRMSPGISGVNNSKNMVSFADGHVNYIKMYSEGNVFMATAFYDPPAGYDYKWSGN